MFESGLPLHAPTGITRRGAHFFFRTMESAYGRRGFMRKKAHVINKKDNVAVAVVSIKAGERLTIDRDGKEEIEVKHEIPCWHKFALNDLEPGDPVVKYGEVIGQATQRIEKGSHVHVHNLESRRGRGDLEKKVKER
jgi:altronate dehydratase small subunit